MEYIDIGNVFMQKRPRKEIQLGEATVKATKLMMVMKGDTLVYNADAFQLAEGSMLDKLISMLPGVELKKDGVITVNGRKVERLLVNGEDFFTGSPKVALENLPAYTVDKVKVYERMNDRDRALGYTKEEVGKQPLAMDVQLKKQYSMGGFANVGGAYGTDGHYGARLFALRFTKQSRIGMYANINDFMGGSYYDSNGNWQTASGGSMATTKDAGLYYLINDRRKRFKVDGNTRFWYHKDTTESKTSTTTFFDSGDVFSRSRQRSVAHELVADAAFNIQITPPDKGLFLQARPQFNYKNYDRTDGSQTADWNSALTERYMGEALDSLFDPDAASHLRENLISSLASTSLAKGHSFRGGGTLQGSWRVPNSPDAVDLVAGGTITIWQIARFAPPRPRARPNRHPGTRPDSPTIPPRITTSTSVGLIASNGNSATKCFSTHTPNTNTATTTSRPVIPTTCSKARRSTRGVSTSWPRTARPCKTTSTHKTPTTPSNAARHTREASRCVFAKQSTTTECGK